MTEIYISTDIETDGPLPGPNSMLSLGSAAFTAEGQMIGTFARNLKTLEGASADPETEKWWQTQPEAWAACRKDAVDPVVAMKDYVEWIESLPGKPVFVGYPTTFDFMFVYNYLLRFVGRSPFSFSALDIKTFAMCLLKSEFRESSKRNMPKHWFSEDLHTHIAVEDAIGQGRLFCNMLQESRKPSETELVSTIKSLLAFIDSKELRAAFMQAWIHGFRVDPAVSEQNRKVVEAAYALVGMTRPDQ